MSKKGIKTIFELGGNAYIGILEYKPDPKPGITFLWLSRIYAEKQGKEFNIVIPNADRYIALPGKRYKKSLIKAFLKNTPGTKVHKLEGEKPKDVYKLIKRLNG